MEVLVEYEYVAVEEDELTIRPGDVITDVIKISDGWMEGNLDGKTGAFPDNFVKEIKKEEKVKSKEAPPPPRTSHKKQGSHVEELAKKIGTQGIKMGPPPSAARVVKRDQPRRLYRAKVTFSYTPENDDELRLEVGDVIDVMQKAEEGWLEGALNGKTGMFPSNFVEVCNEEGPTEEKPAAGEADKKGKKLIGGQGFGNIFNNGPITLRSTSDVKPELESKSSPAPRETEKTASLKRPPPALPPKDVTEGKKLDKARVLFPYVAENEDELSIEEGDIINVLDRELEDSGWWKGELNGKVGVFPDNFVDIIPAEDNKPKKPPPPTINKPAAPDPEAVRQIQRPPAPNMETKPRDEKRTGPPMLPTKKPVMPPPPLSKKPGSKNADYISQTDDHKAQSQKEGPVNLDSVPSGETLTHINISRPNPPQHRRLPTVHREEEKEVRPPRVVRPAPPLPSNHPPLSPVIPHDFPDAASNGDMTQVMAELRKELDDLRSNSVPRSEYDSLVSEVRHLREGITKLEKLSGVLMNDIDEGTKERRGMQVEIDRVKKLSMLPSGS